MDDQSEKHVIDLAEQRKRLLKQRRQGAKVSGAKVAGDDDKSSSSKIGIYLQFIVFIALLAYMMRSCRF